VNAAKTALADHDQSDYAGLGDRMKKISEQQAEIEELELRWFELTEEIG
jgi:ATP-binding cassette subfamily F protein uup